MGSYDTKGDISNIGRKSWYDAQNCATKAPLQKIKYFIGASGTYSGAAMVEREQKEKHNFDCGF